MTSNTNHKPKAASLLKTIYVLVLIMPLPAFAGLGDSADSVLADQLNMLARTTIIPARNYTVYQLASPLGVVVREYVSSSGKVFAVSWRGPFVPEMHRILAKRFELYSLEMQKRDIRMFGRSALNIRAPLLVVQTVGHMRAYNGRAYDPSLLPAGVSIDEIR